MKATKDQELIVIETSTGHPLLNLNLRRLLYLLTDMMIIDTIEKLLEIKVSSDGLY